MSFLPNPLLKRSGSRVQRVSDLPSRTNLSYASDSDINVIVSRFIKTGLLPSSSVPPQFADMTVIPRGTDALMAVRNAQTAFERLPLDLRRELDHKVGAFEPWLRDPKNFDRAVKYGFLKRKGVSKPDGGTPPAGPPVAEKNASKEAPKPE